MHSEGTVLFAERSACGNGAVTVTAHGPWRCLMFNDVEQGLAYMGAQDGASIGADHPRGADRRGARSDPSTDPSAEDAGGESAGSRALVAVPSALGFQYLRVMAAAAVGFCSLPGSRLRLDARAVDGAAAPSVLCVGLARDLP